MKNLIIEALQSVDANKGIAKTKNVSTFLSIEGMTVAELQQFIQDKDVPDNAVITYNAEWQGDYMQNGDAALEWTIQVPTTNEEQEKQRKTLFEHRAWKAVYDKLTSNGYTRKSPSIESFKKWRDVSRYDLFVNGDMDALAEYYETAFKLIV